MIVRILGVTTIRWRRIVQRALDSASTAIFDVRAGRGFRRHVHERVNSCRTRIINLLFRFPSFDLDSIICTCLITVGVIETGSGSFRRRGTTIENPT